MEQHVHTFLDAPLPNTQLQKNWGEDIKADSPAAIFWLCTYKPSHLITHCHRPLGKVTWLLKI